MELVTNKFSNMKVIICFFSILSVAIITSCSSCDNKMEKKIILKLEVFGEFPHKTVVLELVNNSGNDYCILSLEGLDISRLSFNPTTNDTSWIEHGLMFFWLSRTTIPVYNPEMQVLEPDDLYNLQETYNSYPEFKYYYEKMRKMIKNTYDEDRAEYYHLNLYYIFSRAVFIKSNDKWSDTLFFGNYFQNAPDNILKISFNYPPHLYTWEHDTISMKNILHIWQDELGLQMPKSFDGFKVITDEIAFSDSVIVQRVR